MIVFRNPGLIDLRAVRTFGLNSKVTKDPLGFFGTGLKHATAVLLRTGHSMTLWRGLEPYRFLTAKIDSRGKDFELVYMVGHDGKHELPYTTELGKTWENWMAYRELHSNTLDEKGQICRLQEPYIPLADQTAFVVEGPGIEQAYDERDKTFLPSRPFLENEDIEVHHGASQRCYYRGVRVNDLQQTTLYTYNLKKVINGLTEDRTLKNIYDLEYYLERFVTQCENEDYLRAVLLAPSDRYEHHLSDSYLQPSAAFLKVYEELRQQGNVIALTGIGNAVYKRIRKTLPLPPPVALTKVQQQQLDRAKVFCKKVGWLRDYPIEVVPHTRDGMLALAENGKIILTTDLFSQGIKAVVHGILEETWHLEHGFKDLTRDFQTHLFRELINAKEELTGEAL